jgi:membrane-bound serine protease (ClpP class)
LYIEFKTPGFGLPGITGITAFLIYFLGGYVAGLSGMEWIVVFILGLILLALELFVFPGITFLGLAGALLILGSIVMAMVDIYPATPGLPGPVRFQVPFQPIVINLGIAVVGSLAVMWMLSYILPRTTIYSALVSHGVSGEGSTITQERRQENRLGEIGLALSVLRPGGKAQFGDDVLDVITQGDMVDRGTLVRIVGSSGSDAIVEQVQEA